ncbi:MAG TPA: hypothetical protein VG826_34970 [Pirellulales bacterium]|nr:hypothetical protein [Pirellulales bacterium]
MKHYCPCCGFSGLEAPAYRDIGAPPWTGHGPPPYCLRYGDPSYEVCSCCGFEFGNDDDPGTAHGDGFEEYRRQWVASGAGWFNPEKCPRGWSLAAQFRLAGIAPEG